MDAEPPSQSPSPSGYPPADLRRRILARITDALLVAVPFALLDPVKRPVAATLCAAALILCGDRLFGPGRSLGKRLAGLRVIVLQTRMPCGITASMRRNALFAIAILPAAAGSASSVLPAGLHNFPASLAWALCAILGVAVLETSVMLAVLTRDLGRRRLGDLIAGTQVIDASIAIGLKQPAIAARAPTAAAISASPRHAA